MNSWQRGTPAALARNAASLEAMVALLTSEGVDEVGLYSTAHQWGRIVGSTSSSTLAGLPSWLAGASDVADAQAQCRSAAGLTGGPVTLVQYIVDDLDHDASCG